MSEFDEGTREHFTLPPFDTSQCRPMPDVPRFQHATDVFFYFFDSDIFEKIAKMTMEYANNPENWQKP